MAELTDKGRQTTLDLGRRLRELYIHQLGFLPVSLDNPDAIFLRASPYPRALHSLQQVFTGLYPSANRRTGFGNPVVHTSRLSDETLMPNEDFCPRFIELIKAYSKRTARKCDQRET